MVKLWSPVPFLCLWFYHCSVLYLVMSTANATGDAEHGTAHLPQQMYSQCCMVCVLVTSRKKRGPKLWKASAAVTYPESWLYLVKQKDLWWTFSDTKNESCPTSPVFGGCRTSQWVKIAVAGCNLLPKCKSCLYGVVSWKSWACSPRDGAGEWCSVCS